MNFQCPFCQSIVSVENSDCGISVQCGNCGEVTNAPSSRISSGVVIGNDFIILEEIGRGGMGVVFLTHQISLDRRTALKILSPRYASNNEFIIGFIKEARAAAKLNHPHIVQAYAVGEEDGIYYFAMEFIDGETMKSVLKRENVIPIDKALVIIQQVAEALDYAWKEQQLIHRDIKPDNIMLTKNGRAKLADLGLAKFASEIEDADKDEVMGTPQYISPEHLTGMQMDIRSDIYSLGATFFHLATGRFAFTGKDATEIARKHIETPLDNPRSVNPNIPESVAGIIMRMMEKNPDARYQTAEELAEDIRMVRRGKAPSGGIAKPGAGGLQLKKPSLSGKSQAGKTIMMSPKTPSGTDIKPSGSTGIGLGTRPGMHTAYTYSATSAIRKRKEEKAKQQVIFVAVAILICILAVAGFFIFKSMTKKDAAPTAKKTSAGKVPLKAGEVKPGSERQTSQPKEQTPRDGDQKSEIEKKLAEISSLASQQPMPKEQIIASCESILLQFAESEPQNDSDKKALEAIRKIYAPLEEEKKAAMEEILRKEQAEEDAKKQKEEEERKREEAQRLAEEARQREAEAKKREAEEKELQKKEEYSRTLSREKDNITYRAMLLSMKKDFDAASKIFDSALAEKNKQNIPSPDEAKKFSDWAAAMQAACGEAKKFNDKFFNSDTVLAGQKMELAVAPKKTEYLSIVKINNGEITVKDSSGKTFKAMPLSEQPAKSFRILVKKLANELNINEQAFSFLILAGEFEMAKDFALNENSKSLLSDTAISYIRQYLRYNPGEMKNTRAKYGRLEEFKKAVSEQ